MTSHASAPGFEGEVRAALIADGVNAGDAAAVRRWLRGIRSQRHQRYWTPPAGQARTGVDTLPPVRLPPRHRLAELAEDSPLVRDLLGFVRTSRPARQAGDATLRAILDRWQAEEELPPGHGSSLDRVLPPRQLPSPEQTPPSRQAAAMLDREGRTVDEGGTAAGALELVVDTADGTNTADHVGTTDRAGPTPPAVPAPGDDPHRESLGLWLVALETLIDLGRDEEASEDASDRDGVRVAEYVLEALLFALYVDPEPVPLERAVAWLLNDALADADVDGSIATARRRETRATAERAVRRAAERLARHRALRIRADGLVELTGLGRWGMSTRLSRRGMVAPVVGGTFTQDARALLAAMVGYSTNQRIVEFHGWIQNRAPAEIATELLDAAADLGCAHRVIAMSLLHRFGTKVEQQVRERVEDPWTGRHCRAWLAEHGLASEPALTVGDRAWLLVDITVGLAAQCPLTEFMPELLRIAGPGTVQLLRAVPEAGHPATRTALHLLFELHPHPRVTAAAGWLLLQRDGAGPVDEDSVPTVAAGPEGTA